VNHYDVLGVAADASPAEVRAAFRRLARANHPDTSASGSVESLAAINDAWRVLGDPTSRAAYDRALAPSTAPAVDLHSFDLLTPPPESSFPWRFLAGMAAVGIGIAFLGVLTYQPAKPGPPDQLLQPGSCVVIEDNGDAAEVNCDADHDGVVSSLIVTGLTCPTADEPHNDRQGLGVACIRFDI
jgi:molecular chaperone DnaJ